MDGSKRWLWTLGWLFFLGSSVPPMAGGLEVGIGPRLGISRAPNGFELGGQFVLADLGSDVLQPLRLELAADYGSGKTDVDEQTDVEFTALHLNANLEYPILDRKRILRIYPLIGLGWYQIELDRCGSGDPTAENCTRTGAGLNIGGGLDWRRFSVDATIGTGELPTLTITAAFTFGF